MLKPIRHLMLLALLPLLACTSSMMSGQESMRSSVTTTRQENQRHHDAILSATGLPAVASEMNRHDSTMTDMMMDMDGAMDDMQHCTGAGMRQMTMMRTQMTAEMSTHDATMAGSADMDGAHAEAERHAAAMDGMLDTMDGAFGHMDCMH